MESLLAILAILAIIEFFGNHWIFFLNTYLIWLGIRGISKPNLNHQYRIMHRVRQEQGKMNKMKKNKFIEERNEDASKALKCFFVWSWCMHCAVCFWGKKWGREQSTQMFFRLIMRCMYSLLCILSKKWGRKQSTQKFLRLIVAEMSDILIQASCLHLKFHRWDLPLLFYYLCL